MYAVVRGKSGLVGLKSRPRLSPVFYEVFIIIPCIALRCIRERVSEGKRFKEFI